MAFGSPLIGTLRRRTLPPSAEYRNHYSTVTVDHARVPVEMQVKRNAERYAMESDATPEASMWMQPVMCFLFPASRNL